MSVIVILVLVSIALCFTVGLLLFGSRSAASRERLQQKLDAEIKARTAADAELEKRRKELDEQRAAAADAREQLKQAKRKLFEQKESERGGRDLARAREEIERTASIQLESVR
ncbi:MAG TPA: cell envelope biogenesis protein TolA, partial [Myxococcaceae bacterium]|nr:cell envelope biogenesis protein TolA [Myxococcaceae bacterium]